jgi:hypothetical protein
MPLDDAREETVTTHGQLLCWTPEQKSALQKTKVASSEPSPEFNY